MTERDDTTAREMTHAAYLTLDQVIAGFDARNPPGFEPLPLLGILKAIRMQLQIALRAMGREP